MATAMYSEMPEDEVKQHNTSGNMKYPYFKAY
jgi:hypothetical protein